MVPGKRLVWVGLFFLVVLVVTPLVEARTTVPDVYGPPVATGDHQLEYRGGKATAVKGYSATQSIGYAISIEDDTDTTNNNGEPTSGVYSVGSRPWFRIESSCKDADVAFNCPITYAQVRAFIFWDAGPNGDGWADTTNHAVQTTNNEYLYASITLGAGQVPTAGTFDLGYFCAVGETVTGCNVQWTLHDPGAGKRNGPPTGSFTYVGTYRLVIEATATNNGVGGVTGTFNSDNCYYQNAAYRCTVSGDLFYTMRRIGWIRIEESPTFEPRDASCTTSQTNFMRGDETCIATAWTQNGAWKNMPDLEEVKSVADFPAGPSTQSLAVEVGCLSATQCVAVMTPDSFSQYARTVTLVDGQWIVGGAQEVVNVGLGSLHHLIKWDENALLYASMSTGTANPFALWRVTIVGGVPQFDEMVGYEFTGVAASDQDRIRLARAGNSLMVCVSGEDLGIGSSAVQVDCRVKSSFNPNQLSGNSWTNTFSDVDGGSYGGSGEKQGYVEVCGDPDTEKFYVAYTGQTSPSVGRTRFVKIYNPGTGWVAANSPTGNGPREVNHQTTGQALNPSACIVKDGMVWLTLRPAGANQDPVDRATPQNSVQGWPTSVNDLADTAPTYVWQYSVSRGSSLRAIIPVGDSFLLAGTSTGAGASSLKLVDGTFAPLTEPFGNWDPPGATLATKWMYTLVGGQVMMAYEKSGSSVSHIAILNFDATERLNVTVARDASYGSQYLVKGNVTQSSSVSGAVVDTALLADSYLGEYNVDLKVDSYSGASREMWVTFDGATTKSSVAPTTTDPDTGSAYPFGGGLFLEEELGVDWCKATGRARDVLNRGEAVGIECRLSDEWGDPLKAGKVVDVNVSWKDATSGRFETVWGEATVLANGSIMGASGAVPTNVSDTYLGTGTSDETSIVRDAYVKLVYPRVSQVGYIPTGSKGTGSAFLDTDAEYYVVGASATPSGVLMRGDTSRFTFDVVGGAGGHVYYNATAWLYDWLSNLKHSEGLSTKLGESIVDYTIANTLTSSGTHYYWGLDLTGANAANSLSSVGGDRMVLNDYARAVFTLSTLIGVSSIDTNTSDTSWFGEPDAFKVYNRGEVMTVNGCLEHPAGGPLRQRIPSGDVARDVTVQIYLNNYASLGNYLTRTVSVGPSNCEFSTDFDLSVLASDAVDTYNLTANYPDRLVDADGYNWDIRISDSGASSGSNATHNNVDILNQFDLDRNYYLVDNPVMFPLVMREDENRVTAHIRDAQNTTVKDGTSVTIRWKDEAATEWVSGARTTTSGVTATYDYTFPQNAYVGVWKPTYEVVSNVGSHYNSMAEREMTQFELSSNIGVSGIDLDVAGEETSAYFNRGEIVRVEGQLLHAAGGNYRKLRVNGLDEDHAVTGKYYVTTSGAGATGTNQITTASFNIPKATGLIPVDADATVSTTNTDTYTSTTPSVAEAKDWSLVIYDSGVTANDANGNRATLAALLDVDSNYYPVSPSLLPVGVMMRGDTIGTQTTIHGVRAQLIDAVDVTTRSKDGAASTWATTTAATSSGVLPRQDQQLTNTLATGTGKVTWEIGSGATGANGNTMAQTDGPTFTISSQITFESWDTNTSTAGGTESSDAFKVYNRGDYLKITACLKHADGGNYRVKHPDLASETDRAVTLQAYNGAYGAVNAYFEGAADGAGSKTDCVHTLNIQVPTSMTDSWTGTVPRDAADVTRDYNIRAYDGGSSSSNTNGNDATTSNALDADSGYYMVSDAVMHPLVMRADENRFTSTWHDAQGVSVNDGTSVFVEVKNGAGTTRSSGPVTTTSGVTANSDYVFTNNDTTGAWSATYTVTANATNSQNSGNGVGASFTLSDQVALSSIDVDVAGSSTSAYFNRGEVVRFVATVLHADGGAYRKLLANGSAVARSIGLHAYSTTRGEAGSFTTSALSVNPSTGAFTGDVTVDTGAVDTYTSVTPAVGESKGWNVYAYDGGNTTNADGNKATATAVFDVDANYYLDSANVKWPTVMRGDENRVWATFRGVRNQLVPNGVSVGVQYIDPAGGVVVDEGRVTTSGVTQNADTTISDTGIAGTWLVKYYITANATNNMNSLTTASGGSFTLAREIVVTVSDLDVAGLSTSLYFNRGETVRFGGTLEHAAGGAYRKLKADGSSVARSVAAHYYLDARDAAGSFATGQMSVNVGSGVIVPGDAVVSSTAPDTYTPTSPGVADTKNWDILIYEGTTSSVATNYDGNYANLTDYFDVDANYYLNNHTLGYSDNQLRGDTQSAHAGIRNVRDGNVPDGSVVKVTWYDGAGTLRETDTVTTTSGVTERATWVMGASHASGTAHVGFQVLASDGANNENALAVTPDTAPFQWPVSKTITIESFDTNTTVGGNVLKAYNRGETVVASGCLKHPDGGVLRTKVPSVVGADSARVITIQLYPTSGGIGGTGYVQNNVTLGPSVCTFSTSVVVPTVAPDTYTSSVSATNDGAYEYGVRAYDGTVAVASDANGNSQTRSLVLDVDAAIYLDQYWQSRNNTPTTDTDYNSGTNDVLEPDADYSRVYVKNVRGDLTNQFDNIRVERAEKSPNTLAQTNTQTVTLTNSGSGGFYSWTQWGAWPLWTTASLDYAVTSQDSLGNTVVLADAAPITKTGKVHHIVGKADVQDTHVLRSQDQAFVVSAADSWLDLADNNLFDLSAGHILDASLSGRWADYYDGQSAWTTNQSYSGESSLFARSLTIGSSDVLGARDLYLTFASGKLLGREWVTSSGMISHHDRDGVAPTNLGDQLWLVTNQSDWQRSGSHGGVSATSTPGSLVLEGSTGRWTSSVWDVMGVKAPNTRSCDVETSAGGRVLAWLNTSNDNFVNTAGTSFGQFITSPQAGTIQLPSPTVNGRYQRVELVLEGAGTSVSECRFTFGQVTPTASDARGAWKVDDLTVASIAVERQLYDLGAGPSVDATVTFEYASEPGTPENETYDSLLVRLFKPGAGGAGVVVPVPTYADASLVTNVTTNRNGQLVNGFLLTFEAQTGANWYVETNTHATGLTRAFFDVKPHLSGIQWYAHEYSNVTQPFILHADHQRGEEVKLVVGISNNLEAFQPSDPSIADDVDLVMLTNEVVYDSGPQTFTGTWTWPSNATANYGTPHRPVFTMSLNNLTSGTQPSQAANLFSNFTVDNIWHAFTKVDAKESPVFIIGAHLMWEWASQKNVRNESYLIPSNYTWQHFDASGSVSTQNPSPAEDPASVSSNRGAEAQFGIDANHMRTGFASTPASVPAGTWTIKVDALDGLGNNATRSEFVSFNSPINKYRWSCGGTSGSFDVGQQVNVTCFINEQLSDGSVAPVALEDNVYVQFFTKQRGSEILTNLTARQVANTTYFASSDEGMQAAYGDVVSQAYHGVLVPINPAFYTGLELMYRIDTVVQGAIVDSTGLVTIGASGGADPLKVMVPQPTFVAEEFPIDIQSHYLNATARLGASESLFVFIKDWPAGNVLVMGEAPYERGNGFYGYNFTPPYLGYYTVEVITPSASGGVESASNVFRATYNPFVNYTYLQDRVNETSSYTNALVNATGQSTVSALLGVQDYLATLANETSLSETELLLAVQGYLSTGVNDTAATTQGIALDIQAYLAGRANTTASLEEARELAVQHYLSVRVNSTNASLQAFITNVNAFVSGNQNQTNNLVLDVQNYVSLRVNATADDAATLAGANQDEVRTLVLGVQSYLAGHANVTSQDERALALAVQNYLATKTNSTEANLVGVSLAVQDFLASQDNASRASVLATVLSVQNEVLVNQNASQTNIVGLVEAVQSYLSGRTNTTTGDTISVALAIQDYLALRVNNTGSYQNLLANQTAASDRALLLDVQTWLSDRGNTTSDETAALVLSVQAYLSLRENVTTTDTLGVVLAIQDLVLNRTNETSAYTNLLINQSSAGSGAGLENAVAFLSGRVNSTSTQTQSDVADASAADRALMMALQDYVVSLVNRTQSYQDLRVNETSAAQLGLALSIENYLATRLNDTSVASDLLALSIQNYLAVQANETRDVEAALALSVQNYLASHANVTRDESRAMQLAVQNFLASKTNETEANLAALLLSVEDYLASQDNASRATMVNLLLSVQNQVLTRVNESQVDVESLLGSVQNVLLANSNLTTSQIVAVALEVQDYLATRVNDTSAYSNLLANSTAAADQSLLMAVQGFLADRGNATRDETAGLVLAVQAYLSLRTNATTTDTLGVVLAVQDLVLERTNETTTYTNLLINQTASGSGQSLEGAVAFLSSRVNDTSSQTQVDVAGASADEQGLMMALQDYVVSLVNRTQVYQNLRVNDTSAAQTALSLSVENYLATRLNDTSVASDLLALSIQNYLAVQANETRDTQTGLVLSIQNYLASHANVTRDESRAMQLAVQNFLATKTNATEMNLAGLILSVEEYLANQDNASRVTVLSMLLSVQDQVLTRVNESQGNVESLLGSVQNVLLTNSNLTTSQIVTVALEVQDYLATRGNASAESILENVTVQHVATRALALSIESYLAGQSNASRDELVTLMFEVQSYLAFHANETSDQSGGDFNETWDLLLSIQDYVSTGQNLTHVAQTALLLSVEDYVSGRLNDTSNATMSMVRGVESYLSLQINLTRLADEALALSVQDYVSVRVNESGTTNANSTRGIVLAAHTYLAMLTNTTANATQEQVAAFEDASATLANSVMAYLSANGNASRDQIMANVESSTAFLSGRLNETSSYIAQRQNETATALNGTAAGALTAEEFRTWNGTDFNHTGAVVDATAHAVQQVLTNQHVSAQDTELLQHVVAVNRTVQDMSDRQDAGITGVLIYQTVMLDVLKVFALAGLGLGLLWLRRVLKKLNHGRVPEPFDRATKPVARFLTARAGFLRKPKSVRAPKRAAGKRVAVQGAMRGGRR